VELRNNVSPCSVDVDIAWVAAYIFTVAFYLTVIIQLWIEVNTARKTARRETEKETEKRVRISRGEGEKKIKKNWGDYKSKLIKYRMFSREATSCCIE